MRKNSALLASLVLAASLVLVSGCAAKGATLYTENDKDLVLEDFSAITPGLSEKQVVAILGLPASFGIDEEGRHFLRYAETRHETASAAVILPGVGGGETSTRQIFGFEGTIYFHPADNVVVDVAVREWRDKTVKHRESR